MPRPIVKFVSPNYIKENTPMQQNIDDDIIVPYIVAAQDVYIQQALGSKFYQHLKDAIVANNLTADEDNLIRDYIAPVITQFTFYELIPHINYKMTNKAVSQQSSEFSTPSTLDEVKFLRQSVRDLAEFYLKRLNRYLCDYGQLFPLYIAPGSNENLTRNKKSYFTGVYIPRKSGRDYGLPTSYPSNYCDDNNC